MFGLYEQITLSWDVDNNISRRLVPFLTKQLLTETK